jgi:hypothetical protein
MFEGMADEITHQTRVYRFACRGDLPEQALQEMRRAHELSNRLIELEREHEERVQELWRQAPELQGLDEELTGINSELNDIEDRIRQYRQKHRTTKPSAELKKELAEKRKQRKGVKEAIRAEKNRIYPIVKPELVKLGEQRTQAIKGTYKPAVANGLYWANYNFVLDRHKAAVKAVKARRRLGLPSSLRFRFWNGGEGTLVVQLQRQAGQPARTPEVIADDAGRYRNVGYLTPAHDPTHWETLTRPEQRKERMGVLRFRVGQGDEAAGMIEMPVWVHRPIPPEADICNMEIKRRRLGRRYFTFVSVVVRLPATPMRTEGHRVAMHVGWRALGDRSLRVAVVTGIVTPPPDGLRDVVRLHDGWAEIVVPARWRDQMDYVHSLSSIRDKNLDVMKTWLLGWLKDHPDHDIPNIDHIERWRSADRFTWLINHIAEEKLGDADLRKYLCAWIEQDIHVREIEDNLRDKILGRRNDAYRCVAAWLLDTAGLLVIDNYNIAVMAKKPDLMIEDTEAHRAARANRVLASPGILRGSMVDACSRRGVHVQPVDGTISKIHHVCGEELDPAERELDVMVYCPTCQTMVDQDANALELIRHRTEQPAPA